MSDALEVFISYSHDSPEHNAWVLELATRLRSNGVNVTLDQWDLRPGADITLFMEHGIKHASRVIVVCTEKYILKANEGSGGVGYERMIVTGELVKNLGTVKFIPVIRNVVGPHRTPDCLATRLYVDMSDGVDDVGLQSLIMELHHAGPEKPPIGPNPFQAPRKVKDSSPSPLSGSVQGGWQVMELRSYMTRIEGLLMRLRNLKQLIAARNEGRIDGEEFNRLQIVPENVVTNTEVRQLDLLCLAALRKVLPEDHELLNTWFIHEDKGYFVDYDIADFTKKSLQLRTVLDVLDSHGPAEG